MREAPFYGCASQKAALAMAALVSVCVQTASGIQPTGTNIGGIRFDAVIKLSPPLAPAHVVLFARYWVASNFYHLGVVWAEPHGMHLWFPTYPPTLSIGSDEQSFAVTHGLYPERGVRIIKPIGERGVFDGMYGDYPIGKIRFAEQEALADRLYNVDFTRFQPSSPGSSFETAIPLSRTNRVEQRQVTSIEVSANGEYLNWIRLLGPDNGQIKRITYEWDSEAQPPQLRRETVISGQKPMIIGPQSGSLRVKMAQTNYQFKTFSAIHEPDGRNCTIDYQSISLEGNTVRLPVRISVRARHESAIIRSAQMMNFQPFDGDSAEGERLASEFAGFTPAERDYRAFYIKYWQKRPDDVSSDDRVAVEKLRNVFREPLPPGSTGGECMKRANILIELDRILGDERALEEHFQLYLNALSEEGLSEMILDGGFDRIETAVEWGRQLEADALLDFWVRTGSKAVSIDGVLEFAQRQLGSGASWATLKLLDGVRGNASRNPATQFQFTALKCLLLKDIRALSTVRQRLKGSAKARAEWTASHTSEDEIDELLRESLASARVQFAAFQNPSSVEKAFNNQVEAAARSSLGK